MTRDRIDQDPIEELTREPLDFAHAVLAQSLRTFAVGVEQLERFLDTPARPLAASMLESFTVELERMSAAMFRRRRGRVIEGDHAWCAECGRTVVDCSKGTDLCLTCLPIVHHRGGGA